MYCRAGQSLALVAGLLGLVAGLPLAAQVPAALQLTPNLVSNIERPLRYSPDGGDFVIRNGAEFFNRPLYGRTTAFRVDAGDKPEFVLYLPGRGGNLRLGIRKVERADPSAFSSTQRVEVNALHPDKWLHDAANLISRYRPGGMLYEVRDPLLGPAGVLRITAYALHQTDGLILRAEAADVAAGVELVWAYGGVNGQRGRRDGDIGTETVPISEWFQLKPEFCQGNRFEIAGDAFTLRAKLPRDQTATVRGIMPVGAQLTLADVELWNDLNSLLSAVFISAPESTVVVGRVALTTETPLYLALQRIDENVTATELDTYREVTAPRVTRADPSALASGKHAEVSAFHPADLPRLFAETEAHFAALRNQVRVETPDPYINAAIGALNVAADAVWDEPQGAVMHGAIAWRSRLLGWRGPYAMDALGWHDRARRHLVYWATRQNTDPIPEKLPPPDADANLARSEAALHSNGDLSNSHYDMNLVFIDALFRHLLWTGDVAFAREVWPVIERHLAWERRLFRREFEANGGKLPLYEAYAAIWASDDLQYSGGGTAHGSAYNYWHNRMAARLAPLVGADPAPYTREADFIARGMRVHLWTGTHFAESKDLLGRQLVHPSAALWTFYHTMDAGLPNAEEAGLMSDEMLRRLPALPVRGPGVPADQPYAVRASTDWLPYSWSINNVVMGENIHTALGLWQAGRSQEAFTLTKSALLASMFMGICPGNVGSMNYLDVYRRESQRDFADGSGVLSRAVVEGLFGVRPDALAGELRIVPGWPADWRQFKFKHPQVELVSRRDGPVERLFITPRFSRPMALRLELPLRGTPIAVVVNGRDMPVHVESGPEPRLIVTAPPDEMFKVSIGWEGEVTGGDRPPDRLDGPTSAENPPGGRVPPVAAADPEVVDLTPHFNDRVTEIFKPGKYLSPRSPFVSLALPSQGIGAWAGHVNATAEIDDTGLRRVASENGGRLVLPGGLPFVSPGPGGTPNILFVSQWDNYPREAVVPLTGKARHLHLLMAGSTNHMQSRLDNGEVVVTYTDGTTSRLALRNPETWWPIEQDYFTDDYQFRVDGPLPTRVDLKTGAVRVLEKESFKGQGRVIPGGAATVLELFLDPDKELSSVTVRALANDVVIGLMAATLER